MQIKQIHYNNAAVFYRVTGEGKPVILLHGFGEDGDVWEFQMEELKDHYRLIIPDLPGSGLSPLPNEAAPGLEYYAEIIHSIIITEKAEGCILLGHSMGGYISLALVEKYPLLLRGFGLLHSSAFADTDEKKENRLKSIDFIRKNGSYLFLKTSIPGLFSPERSPSLPTEYPDLLIKKGNNFSSLALEQYYRAMLNRPDRTHILKQTSLPVLFILGPFDIAAPIEKGLQECHFPATSHLTILRQSAHMGMLEEFQKTNLSIRQYLKATC